MNQDPAPATNLNMKRVNKTCMNLSWTNPVYNYDILDIQCLLNEENIKLEYNSYTRVSEKIFRQDVDNGRPASFVLKNLIPGGVYNCSITSVRKSSNYTAKTNSPTVYQITGNYQTPLKVQYSIQLMC